VVNGRLATEERFKNGPYANVVYLDNGEPHAEFSFTYKSMGILYDVLIVDLLQAMGVVPVMPPPLQTLAPMPKRSRYDEDDSIREENKRLKVSTRGRSNDSLNCRDFNVKELNLS
jgi:hypothetical protein